MTGKLLQHGWTLEDMRKHPVHDLYASAIILARMDILANPPPADDESLHKMVKDNPDSVPAIEAYYDELAKLYGGPVQRPGKVEEESP